MFIYWTLSQESSQILAEGGNAALHLGDHLRSVLEGHRGHNDWVIPSCSRYANGHLVQALWAQRLGHSQLLKIC